MAKSRKLAMKKRETKQQISVSFTKRRHGLFNKAVELFMFGGAQLAILVSSPSSKPRRKIYSFGHPSVDFVFDAFLRNCIRFPIDHDQAKQYALSLLKEIDSLESESSSSTVQSGNANSRQDFGSGFEIFENSESIEELQMLVHALAKLIDCAKSRFNHCKNGNDLDQDSPNSVLTEVNHTCPTSKLDSSDALALQDLGFWYNYDNYSVFPTPESASCYGFKDEEANCNVINDAVPELNLINSCYVVGEASNSKEDEQWSFTSLPDVGVELNNNESRLDSKATATLEMAPQKLLYAKDNEDPFSVDGWLWSSD